MADLVVIRRNDDGTLQEVAAFPAADAASLNIRANGWETLFDGALPAAPAGGGAGVKGDKGDQGIQGIPGLKGDKGDKGDQGIQGVQGIPGTNGTGGTPPSQGDFTGAVQAAFAGDTVLNWLGGDVTLAAPIVLNVTQWKFAFGIRLNGAKVACSFATDAAIHIVVPVVNGHVIQNVGMRNFTLCDGHFTGGYGALRMECRSNGSWLGFGLINNVSVDGHSGYAFELLGSVFEGKASNVTTTNGKGGFHARTCGLVEPDPNGTDHDKGLPSALYIDNPDFRDWSDNGILLSSSTYYQEPFDLTVTGGYIVTGQGRAITAPSGIKLVQGTGIENVKGDSMIYVGYRGGSFKGVTGANPNVQTGPYPLIFAQISGNVLIEDCGVQNEGSGTNAILANVTGAGTVFMNRSGASSAVSAGTGVSVKVAQYA